MFMCWNTKPMRVRRSLAFSSSQSRVSSVPQSQTAPPSGVSIPATLYKSVDFPEPDGPMIASISPRAISKDTPCKMRDFERFSTSSSVSIILLFSHAALIGLDIYNPCDPKPHGKRRCAEHGKRDEH